MGMTGQDLLQHLQGLSPEVLALPILVPGGGGYGWDPLQPETITTKAVVITAVVYRTGTYAEEGVENLQEPDEPPMQALVLGPG